MPRTCVLSYISGRQLSSEYGIITQGTVAVGGLHGTIVPGSWRCGDAYRCFRRKITLNNVAQTKRPAKVHLSQIYVPRLYRKWIIYWRSAVDQSACPCLGSQSVDEKRIYLVSDSRGPYSCQQSYLLLFGITSPTHSFIPGLKPSFSVNPLHCSPSFLLLQDSLHGFPRLFIVISEHICFVLLVFLFLHFLVVGSVR